MVKPAGSMGPDGVIAPPTCIACKALLRFGAKKCPECGSFQGRRRHLRFGGTVLSLLVALVSVTALGIPIVVSVFTVVDSEIEVEVLDLTLRVNQLGFGRRAGSEREVIDAVIEIDVIYSNYGEVGGYVDRVRLATWSGEGVGRVRSYHIDVDDYVPPQSFNNHLASAMFWPTELGLTLTDEDDLLPDWLQIIRSWEAIERAQIVVTVINYDLTEERFYFDFDQPIGMSILRYLH